MNEIQIKYENEQLVVSSLQVAKDFEKEHFNVVRDIENLMKKGCPQECRDLFYKTTYTHEQNKQEYPMYLINKKGFQLLAMGFTGKKAIQWKLKYIDAFEAMETEIKQRYQLPTSPQEVLKLLVAANDETNKRIDNLEDNLPLFNIDCEELQRKVKAKVFEVMGGKNSLSYKDNSTRSQVYTDIQTQLRREFGVKSFKAIKRCQLDKAMETVTNYSLPFALKEQIDSVNKGNL